MTGGSQITHIQLFHPHRVQHVPQKLMRILLAEV